MDLPSPILEGALGPGGRIDIYCPEGTADRMRLIGAQEVPYVMSPSNPAGLVDVHGPVTSLQRVAAGTYQLISSAGHTQTVTGGRSECFHGSDWQVTRDRFHGAVAVGKLQINQIMGRAE